MGSLSPWHWLIVVAAVVLLFGSSKLPAAARSLGQSARVLKAEARGMREDEQDTSTSATSAESGTSAASGSPQTNHQVTGKADEPGRAQQ